MTTLQFSNVTAEKPTPDSVAEEYKQRNAALDEAADAAATVAVVRQWDELRRRLATWDALVYVRFQQDTRDQEAKSDMDYKAEIGPKLTEHAIGMMRRLTQGEHRAAVEAEFGPQVLALWDSEILTFDPAIQQELEIEEKTENAYNELCASAELEFRGETYNLSTIVKFSQDPDRNTRRGADQVRWNWFSENGEALDVLYDRLVSLRNLMAQKLGYETYVEMGYKRMCRVDYNREDVEFYRAQVREHVVPLCTEIREKQRQRLGLDRMLAYDEPLYFLEGNPKPQGDHDWMVERAKEMFDDMGGGLGEFFRKMADGGFMDLKSREGKAGGGFCTDFSSYGMPFIYANFNGTKGDVEVFTHEMGHAYQVYSSREQPLYDYLWPTYESCEIHSMGLEFLTWPHMDSFFDGEGDPKGGERFREVHLAQSLLFLPYGVAVDHFQHEIYENPAATPSERHAMWRDMEKIYLPHRDWGDLEYPAKGGRWQFQRHIYLNPFYYIDYTLAQCCALQFWLRAEENRDAAMTDFVALCKRGGEAPFQALAREAGLTSPFEEGCLAGVAEQARSVLNV